MTEYGGMQVLISGGAGPVGVALIPALVAQGHRVTGIAHTPVKAARLRDLGARHVRADLFVPESVRSAVLSCTPNVIIHLATGDERLCEEGTTNLIEAARLAGVRRVVARGAAFAYSPSTVACSESAPLYVDAPRAMRKSVQSFAAMEQSVLGDPKIEGLVLRFGTLYGPGTLYSATGVATRRVLRRRLPIVGQGRGWFGFVHVEDAAAALVASLREPAGVLNIVDDEPVRTSEWLPRFAAAIGAKPPHHVPARLLGTGAGVALRYFFDQQPSVSNAAAREALRWAPRTRPIDLTTG